MATPDTTLNHDRCYNGTQEALLAWELLVAKTNLSRSSSTHDVMNGSLARRARECLARPMQTGKSLGEF